MKASPASGVRSLPGADWQSAEGQLGNLRYAMKERRGFAEAAKTPAGKASHKRCIPATGSAGLISLGSFERLCTG